MKTVTLNIKGMGKIKNKLKDLKSLDTMMEIAIYNDREYAAAVEYGSPGRTIKSKTGKYMVFPLKTRKGRIKTHKRTAKLVSMAGNPYTVYKGQQMWVTIPRYRQRAIKPHAMVRKAKRVVKRYAPARLERITVSKPLRPQLKAAMEDISNVALGQIKKNTPVATGLLRKSWRKKWIIGK